MKTAESWQEILLENAFITGNVRISAERTGQLLEQAEITAQIAALETVLRDALDLNDGHDWPISRKIQERIATLTHQQKKGERG